MRRGGKEGDEGGRRGRESEAAPFTVVVLERVEEGERRAKRERKGAEGGAEGGPLLARGVEDFGSREGAERGPGVVVGRGGGEEEVWRATGGRVEDAVADGERSGRDEAGVRRRSCLAS